MLTFLAIVFPPAAVDALDREQVHSDHASMDRERSAHGQIVAKPAHDAEDDVPRTELINWLFTDAYH